MLESDGRVETAARALLEVRRAGRLLAAPPFGLRDVAEAYAIQNAVAASLGGIAAWKVGAKGPSETPTCAPVLAGLLHRSPVALPATQFGMIGIEAELAFRLGRDLPAETRNLSLAEISGAVATVHPAIEVVDTRIGDWRQAEKLWLLADNQMNAGLVYGDGVAVRPDLALERQPVALWHDGKIVAEAQGGNPAGDPWRVLAWLVNHCRRERGGLKAGMVITTGSCTGMIFVKPGAVMRAAFPGIGEVEIDFPPRPARLIDPPSRTAPQVLDELPGDTVPRWA